MKYPDDFVNKIINGDCLEIMKDIPETELYKMVLITDPPYGINYDPKWLSEMNLAKGTKANSTDKKVINDEKPMDLNFLFKFPRRIIFGYPYIPDHAATGWLVWDKQPKVDERGITTPVEIASTTLRKGYDIFRHMWGGVSPRTR